MHIHKTCINEVMRELLVDMKHVLNTLCQFYNHVHTSNFVFWINSMLNGQHRGFIMTWPNHPLTFFVKSYFCQCIHTGHNPPQIIIHHQRIDLIFNRPKHKVSSVHCWQENGDAIMFSSYVSKFCVQAHYIWGSL